MSFEIPDTQANMKEKFWWVQCLLVAWHRYVPSICSDNSLRAQNTIHPKKYAHASRFAVVCCGIIAIYFPLSVIVPVASLALGQSSTKNRKYSYNRKQTIIKPCVYLRDVHVLDVISTGGNVEEKIKPITLVFIASFENIPQCMSVYIKQSRRFDYDFIMHCSVMTKLWTE